jgi:3-hydroxyisobutyrate dehydrogenase-like beta-hydroxyacid dehydrogenase
MPMAQRIQHAGWPLHVWARRPGVTQPLADAGARVASSIAEVAEQVDLLSICVVADDDVLEVVGAAADGLRAGAMVAIHSTVLPATCVEVRDRLRGSSVDVLDAPVSGGAVAANAGRLVVMVGGEQAVFDRARPVFDSFGSSYLLGGLGCGQLMKLLNNAMLTAHLRLAYDAVQIATDLGLDPRVAEQVLQGGSGGSAAIQSMIRFRQLDLNHVRARLEKDVHHYQEVAGELPASAMVTRLSVELLDRLGDGTLLWSG